MTHLEIELAFCTHCARSTAHVVEYKGETVGATIVSMLCRRCKKKHVAGTDDEGVLCDSV
jgi:hypothetical protein